jgi:hypothetical protein
VDATFLREAVLRLIKVESPGREVVVTGFRERDHLDNLRYICNDFETPVTAVTDGEFNCMGMSLSPPLQTAVDKVLLEKSLTSVQLAAFQGCTVQCASTNLNNLLTSSPTSIFDRRQRREGRGFLLQRAQPQAT